VLICVLSHLVSRLLMLVRVRRGILGGFRRARFEQQLSDERATTATTRTRAALGHDLLERRGAIPCDLARDLAQGSIAQLHAMTNDHGDNR
jgi:hypothetical protein